MAPDKPVRPSGEVIRTDNGSGCAAMLRPVGDTSAQSNAAAAPIERRPRETVREFTCRFLCINLLCGSAAMATSEPERASEQPVHPGHSLPQGVLHHLEGVSWAAEPEHHRQHQCA